MGPNQGPRNPITATPGQLQYGVDPLALRPSRLDLVRARVEYQRSLIRAGQARYTPITVSPAGVIIDGHHAVRASAEEGKTVDVLVAPLPVVEKARTVLDLSVR